MDRKKPKWSQESLKKAIEAVNNGMGKRKAAETFGIPWGTFSDKLSGRRKLEGTAAQTVLTTEEELEVVNFLKSSAKRGFGKTREELLVTVQNMLNFRGRETKWKDNLPQEKWFRLFKKRFPELVFRTPQKLGKQRAMVTKDKLLKWFQDFADCVKSVDPTILLEPDRIYNCDESGFSLDASTGKVLSFTGAKFVYQIACEQRLMITVLACCSASGHFVWPMLIYPGKVFRGFQPNNVFQEAFITKSVTGWTNQTIFKEWLETVFIPQTEKVKKPLLLLVDGHISHMSIRAAEICIENNIILYALPPHASHIMQPLDVGVFRTMKNEWRKAVKKQNEVEVITKRSFATVFKSAYENTVSRNLAAKAFKNSGLFPFDPSNIQWEKVLPTSEEPGPAGDAPVEQDINPTPLISSTSLATDSPTAPSDHIATPTATSAIGLPVAATSALPVAATSAIHNAGTSSYPDASKDRASTLRKFAMISAQVGEATLNKYFERLEEGYDCADPVYELWKTYHEDIVNDTQVSTHQAKRPSPIQKDPLTTQCVQKGPPTKRRKVQQPPSLISGQQFVQILIEKKLSQKEEEERKVKRKAEMEKKKIEKVKQDEEKKRMKEEREKKREEMKKQKEEEMKKRKENRLRKQEERRIEREMEMKKACKGKGKKRRDSVRSTDSSVDESEMVLDDRSDEDLDVNVIEDLLMDDTFEVAGQLRAHEDDGEQAEEESVNENVLVDLDLSRSMEREVEDEEQEEGASRKQEEGASSNVEETNVPEVEGQQPVENRSLWSIDLFKLD